MENIEDLAALQDWWDESAERLSWIDEEIRTPPDDPEQPDLFPETLGAKGVPPGGKGVPLAAKVFRPGNRLYVPFGTQGGAVRHPGGPPPNEARGQNPDRGAASKTE